MTKCCVECYWMWDRDATPVIKIINNLNEKLAKNDFINLESYIEAQNDKYTLERNLYYDYYVCPICGSDNSIDIEEYMSDHKVSQSEAHNDLITLHRQYRNKRDGIWAQQLINANNKKRKLKVTKGDLLLSLSILGYVLYILFISWIRH